MDGPAAPYVPCKECNSPAPLPGQEGCLGLANETIACVEKPCECEFTSASFKNLLGYESSNIVGWVEKDGVVGPTSPEENVYLGDPIQNGVTVHVLCSNCTCIDGEISCAIEECTLQNCTYSSWSDWTPCSKTCNVGQMSRNRSLIASLNQQACIQPLDEFQDCNTDACFTVHPWSPWSEWTACSTTEPCQVGTISRIRKCPDSSCLGDAMELETCTNNCEQEINCTAGKVWSNCSNLCPLTCQAARMGVCSEPEACVPGCTCPDGQVEYHGQCVKIDSCPCYDELGNIILSGFSYSLPSDSCKTCTCYNGTLSCTVYAECCSWSTWGEWGMCGVSCGEGTKKRYRSLQSGSNCGESINTAPCYMGECPPGCIIDGVGYAYGDIISNDGCEQCYCLQTGEKYCFNNTAAIVDGEWGAWSTWFDCSTTCKGGVKARTRLCNDPLPACNGFPCPGDNTEFTSCNEAIDCCEVYTWSEWSDCSASCGTGQQMRSHDYVDANNTICTANLSELRPCNYGECNKCETNQVWSDYSLCEMTCGELVYGSDPTKCTIPSEGCMCEKGFYRNQNGSCVNASICELCITDSGIKQPGELWDEPIDSCYMCECVSGVKICNRKCEIPTCSNDKILSYDVPNSCCPICIPLPSTCMKFTRYEKLMDSINNCETTNEMPLDYCAGSCGNSTTTTTLMLHLDGDALSQDCKCCTGTLGDLLEVDVVCGAARTPAKAYLYRLLQCSCSICPSLAL
ncbi:hypothetical protein ACJMK2_023412 [Sinanodonta woodiana]|uniref:SCO-spondin n=1 Tax=Sinanodonta woodiana TaxID=1069815 RepID=A0ABD3T4Q5_SINWO